MRWASDQLTVPTAVVRSMKRGLFSSMPRLDEAGWLALKTNDALIQKWLEAGILGDGIVTVDDRGTGQGLVIFAAPCQHPPALLLRSLG